MTLDQVPLRQTVEIRSIDVAPHRNDERLLELGLTPGTQTTVCNRARGGDPLIIEVRGTLLSLRREDAARICVTA